MKEIILQSPVGPEITLEGKKCLYFGGTDYLGMANRPEVLAAAHSALESFGLSPSASRGTSGTTELHLSLERAISSFAGSEDAALVCTGYMSMCALLEAAAGKDDMILLQDSAHPSIRMAARVSELPCLEFDPLDLDGFEETLRGAGVKSGRLLVAAEGVAPLTGRLFPLPGILDRLGERNALVLLDDAHAFGVLGERGRGTAEHYEITDSRVLCCATLSKAFGSAGGCVPGSRKLVDRVRLLTGAYLAATPPPAPVLGAARAALELVTGKPLLIERLRSNTTLLKNGINDLGLPVDPTPVPIVPIWFDNPKKMLALSERLLERNILAPYGNYPGSPEGGLIRLAVTAAHTVDQISYFLDCLKETL